MIKKIIKKFKDLFDDKKLLFISLIIIAIIILIIIYGFDGKKDTDLIPSSDVYKTNPPPGTNTWNDITPGITEYNEEIASNIFGHRVDKKRYKGRDVYLFEGPPQDSRHNEVGVDRYGVVSYMRVVNPYKTAGTFTEYKERLKLEGPDISKYSMEGNWVQAFVYLDEGVMLEVRENVEKVYAVLYFPPMTKEEFKSFWGSRLMDEFVLPQDYPRNP